MSNDTNVNAELDAVSKDVEEDRQNNILESIEMLQEGCASLTERE